MIVLGKLSAPKWRDRKPYREYIRRKQAERQPIKNNRMEREFTDRGLDVQEGGPRGGRNGYRITPKGALYRNVLT